MNRKLSKHKNSDKKNIISIVTAKYNSVYNIDETILSVINQAYQNIEYIIIDGGSKDSTIDMVKKYQNSIGYLISKKDDGIYDAMNKDLQLASRNGLIFF